LRDLGETLPKELAGLADELALFVEWGDVASFPTV
jgi:hypothetical protein